MEIPCELQWACMKVAGEGTRLEKKEGKGTG